MGGFWGGFFSLDIMKRIDLMINLETIMDVNNHIPFSIINSQATDVVSF